MIGIIGPKTTIAHAMTELLPEAITPIGNPSSDMLPRYLFTAGFLAGQQIEVMSAADVQKTWAANFVETAARCDQIIACNPEARICIIGSESGIKGSFDMAYAGAKAALHLYIESKELVAKGQQIVGIAPTVIADSGMTARRRDINDCFKRGMARRRGEWLTALDVAKLAYFLLYVDDGTISNTVIRQNMGTW